MVPVNSVPLKLNFTVWPGEYLNSIAIFNGYGPRATEDTNPNKRRVGGTNVCGEYLDADNFD